MRRKLRRVPDSVQSTGRDLRWLPSLGYDAGMPGHAGPQRTEITHFVRGTLGCGCPDEVFDSIAVEPAVPVADGLPVLQLLVGRRLLIQLVALPRDAMAADWIERLATAGRVARDRHGYNRFRLVVVTSPGQAVPAGLDERFARLAGTDERIHLHCIAQDHLPEALSAPLAAMSPAVGAGRTDAK
jgi:hypothetical protein